MFIIVLAIAVFAIFGLFASITAAQQAPANLNSDFSSIAWAGIFVGFVITCLIFGLLRGGSILE